MKYIKKFNNNKYPNVGDYIVCKKAVHEEEYWTFISQNIGKIVKSNGNSIIIQYDTIPPIDVLDYGFFPITDTTLPILQDLNYKKFYNKFTNLTSTLRNRVEFCSKLKKEVDAYITAKKYNI